MADFAVWVEAAAPELGWEPEQFLKVYERNRAGAIQDTVEADPVAAAARDFCHDEEDWEGTLTDLLTKLCSETKEEINRSKAWPTSAAQLSNRLRRAAPGLRSLGVEVTFGKRRGQRWIRLRLLPKDTATSATSATKYNDFNELGGGDEAAVGGAGGANGGDGSHGSATKIHRKKLNGTNKLPLSGGDGGAGGGLSRAKSRPRTLTREQLRRRSDPTTPEGAQYREYRHRKFRVMRKWKRSGKNLEYLSNWMDEMKARFADDYATH